MKYEGEIDALGRTEPAPEVKHEKDTIKLMRDQDKKRALKNEIEEYARVGIPGVEEYPIVGISGLEDFAIVGISGLIAISAYSGAVIYTAFLVKWVFS